nr:TonB-dependent receptor [Acinetobacter sp. Marseille-Q1620]
MNKYYFKYIGKLKDVHFILCACVAVTNPIYVHADDDSNRKDHSENPQKVVKVAVTGSRISKAEKDGPTSVTVITGEDIDKQGYSNAFEALNNLAQNTGFVQGADFGNTFTPAANAISLRGLGPNHTLTLINGHRVADYPVAYEGNVNFVNLANIPTAIIDRIEVLNGGASAIYGSDAIAGVVNIILKKKTDGTQINLKGGGTRNGGENGRLQLSGSNAWEKLNLVYALELSSRESIAATDINYMASQTRLSETPRTIAGRKDAKSGAYLSLGGCNHFGGLFGGTVRNIGENGRDNCTSDRYSPTFWTLQTQNRSQNGYLGLNYALNDKTEIFGDILIGGNQIENNTRGSSWSSLSKDIGFFLNQNTGNYEIWNRRFAPEEFGGIDKINSSWNELSTNINLGVRGDIGESSWKYEAAYNGSLYNSRVKRRGISLANIDEFFLGPRLGSDADGIPIYAPDINKLNKPINAKQFNQIMGSTTEKDRAWVQTFSFSANGDLFKLPAGTVKLATIAEIGRQGFNIKPDAKLQQGVFYNSSSNGEYGGNRSRQALGAELYLPVTKLLNLSLSSRYDRYALSDNSIDKFTFGSGIEFRPLPTLLFRSNYETSFRAPDMNYLFMKKQNGYYAATTDYLRCQQQGQPLSSCEYRNYSPGADYTLVGNQDLKPEEGRSYGFGFVWSPSNKFDISVDYWDIKIDDLVTNLSSDKLLRTEANCRAGIQDMNSSQCIDAFSRIQRNPSDALVRPGEIDNITVQPINAASERTRGIDLATKWRWKTDNYGNFLWAINYTRVLAHDYKQSKSDAKEDLLHDLDSSDWRDRFNTALSWNIDNFSSTVLLNRLGKVSNGDQTAYLTPTYYVNWSGTYQVNPKTSVSVIVNNLFDKVKHDYTGGWPYYPVGTHSPFGRQAWLELNYKF